MPDIAATVIAEALVRVRWPDGEPMIRLARVHRQTVGDVIATALQEAGFNMSDPTDR